MKHIEDILLAENRKKKTNAKGEGEARVKCDGSSELDSVFII